MQSTDRLMAQLHQERQLRQQAEALLKHSQEQIAQLQQELSTQQTSLRNHEQLNHEYNPEGEITGHFGIQRDVTDRQQTLDNLQQISNALSHAVEGIAQLDQQGFYQVVNQAYASMIGYQPAELIGQPWQQTVHPDDLDRVVAAYNQMLIDGKVEIEARGLRKDHSIFYKQLTMVTAYNNKQQAIGHYCFMKDISDRKRQEEILKNIALGVSAKTGEAFFQALVEYLTKALDVEFALICELIAPEGKQIRTIAGYGDSQITESFECAIINSPCEQVIRADQPIYAYPRHIQQLFPNDGFLQEVQAESYMGLPLLNSSGQVLGLIAILSRQPMQETKFTAQILQIFAARAAAELERQQAEIELKQQKQDLARSNADLARSNAELQQFAYVASHDLQEPLRMVTSYLELLERRYKGQLDDKADLFINYAVDGSTRMQTLINDLLSYSRVGTKEQSFESVDCQDILNNALKNLQVTIAQNNARITHDPLPQVNGDPTQLTQLLQNLISNGIKFRQAQAPQIHIGIKQLSGKWLFSVRDNGIGIESQYTDRIFVIFQRLYSRAEYPGTGIGLAICKKIVERHGGTLWVESQLNQGSTFYFTLSPPYSKLPTLL